MRHVHYSDKRLASTGDNCHLPADVLTRSYLEGAYMKPLIRDIVSDTDICSHSRRRAYVAPSLTCYGLVQDLTQASSSGPSENGSAGCGGPQRKPNSNCPSDSRIKTDIRLMSTSRSGLPLYLFTYKPEFKAACGHGTYFGFMAQDLLQKYPSAVVTRPDGYYAIDYHLLRTLMH